MACFLRYQGEFKSELLRQDLLQLMERDYVYGYLRNTYLNSWDWWDLKQAMDFCLAVKGVSRQRSI
ncbi:MAG: hypothetical protein HC847_20230 [Hydrococcus sp. RU_2_2]|nr:hypothetical protein [Hydrococcus sp. RU_2_2]